MSLSPDALRNLMGARHAFALAALEVRRLRIALALKVYNPNQPRVPAGNPDGGRWTSEGGGGDVGSPDATLVPVAHGEDERPYKVDLEQEERRGGHTLREHLGRTDGELVARLEREHWRFGPVEVGRRRAGTFFSLGEANEYVNKTLEANRATVEQVASG